ncbi:Molybdate transporter 2 [Fagus crenata]
MSVVFGNSFVDRKIGFWIGVLVFTWEDFGSVCNWNFQSAFAGIELAMACKDMNTKQELFVMLVCVAVSLTDPVLLWVKSKWSVVALGFTDPTSLNFALMVKLVVSFLRICNWVILEMLEDMKIA